LVFDEFAVFHDDADGGVRSGDEVEVLHGVAVDEDEIGQRPDVDDAQGAG
jgi:hypothetical protein